MHNRTIKRSVDKQIKLNKYKYIMSRTDARGYIDYVNDYFSAISGYSNAELLGQNHNIIRNPDMPKIIFELMWKRLKNGQNIHVVVKNMAKNGEYYWVTLKFDIKRHPYDNKIVGYVAYAQAASATAIKTISELYRVLLMIEKDNSIEASMRYLQGYLEEKRLTYDEYIDEVIENNTVKKIFFKTKNALFNSR